DRPSAEEMIRLLNSMVGARESADSESPGLAADLIPAKTSLNAGDVFADRYRIEERIGPGSKSVVYKAIDQMIGAPVALKVMNKNAVESQTAKERLKREIILARKVAHPNVSRIYDIGEYRSVPYVSMEYVKGESLASILKQRTKLPAQE